jgi:hypothetical protein
MNSSKYTPNNWVIIKVKETGLFKVLGGWSGGYLDGDYWRLNSGIIKVELDGNYWLFYGNSGSIYKCHKDSYRLSHNTSGIYRQLDEEGLVDLLDDCEDWLNLLEAEAPEEK